MTPGRHSFTIKSNAIQNRLVTSCWVYASWTPESGTPQPPRKHFNALWDTGATESMITRRVVEDLGLQAEGFTNLYHVQGEAENVQIYYVNLLPLSDVHFADARVAEGKLLGNDVLIGMDIINKSDFAVSNRDGATTFSFRIPSMESFDFVKEDGEFSR